MKAEDAIERVVEILTREAQPDEVLLFGSRAKGTAHRGSDIDLAIVGGLKLSHRERKGSYAKESRTSADSIR